LPNVRASLTLAVSGALGAASLTALLAPAAGLGAGLCLASLFGAAGGLLVLGLQRLLSRLPWPWLVHTSLGALFGYWSVASPLGAWSKLHGDHRTMALATLVLAPAWGAGLGASILALRLYAGMPVATRGRLLGRLALVATLGLLGLLLGMYEATQGWLQTYPAARTALFGSAWWCAALASCLLVSWLPERLGKRAVALAAGLLGAIFFGSFAVAASTWAGLARAPHTEHWVKLARTLSDFDRDGFSHWFGGTDCAPFDAKVSPRAREIPGNGIDDNCRYGDAPRAGARVSSVSYVDLPPPTLNIVLVTIDALRAHHTTPYGYARDTTPNLQALSAGSVRFENAYTSGGWTCLALPSLFSGLYPRRLIWRPLILTDQRTLEFPWRGPLAPGERIITTLTLPAQEPAWSLPSALQKRGYRTLAAGNHPILTQAVPTGWDRVLLVGKPREDASTIDALLPELAQQQGPFFLWLHLFDAHDPQTEHADVPSFGSTMLDLYDHEIASADKQLGRVLRALDGRTDTALIVAADHGEAFQWGFQFHGADLYEDSIRIPLFLRAPGLQPGVNTSPASLVDIAPTVLALSGTPRPTGLDGRDLRQLHGDEPVLTDLFRVDEQGTTTVDQVAATTSRLRLVRDHVGQVDFLVRTHDLQRPPQLLPMQLAPRQLFETLGRYQESLGGP
jgi:arylsulfatase A-like enzyme